MQTRALAMEDICQLCGKEPSKYTCPSCGKKTCSLPCLKEHKILNGIIICTGKRIRNSSHYTPLSKLQEADIKDDFFLLEETEQKITHSANNNCQVIIPQRKRRLVKYCKGKGIDLILLPSFMSRSKNNRSSLSRNDSSIPIWTLDFSYKGLLITTHNNSSSAPISSLLPKEFDCGAGAGGDCLDKEKSLFIYSHSPNKDLPITLSRDCSLEEIIFVLKPRILEYPRIIIK